MLSIEKWESDALPPLGGLVAESAAQGFAMLRRLVDDWNSRANRFDKAGETLFLASADGMVVGVCGLNVDPFAADPNIGRLRHLFVTQTRRRCGIGRALVQRIIDHASSHFRTVRLRTHTQEGDAFYRSMGFAVLPDESSATHVLNLDHGTGWRLT